ncbi:MAG: PEP-CTERM sorting domain-containing protein [Armatimonadota bacterium]|nr:PEP-CTERM sorting domain-containing protein [Armatimonadota bacterium]
MFRLLGLKTIFSMALACLTLVANSVTAAPLSNTTVSWTAFASTWAPTNIQVLESPFTFADGASGKIVSIAYFSTGGTTAGKWVYAYQVIFNSGAGKIHGIYISPAGSTTTVEVTPNFSFKVSKPSGAGEFPQFLSNGVTTVSGDYTDSELVWVFQAPGILAGQNSVVFGYVSDFHPTVASADLSKVNGSSSLPTPLPLVLVASPEPSGFLLLSFGLLGFVGLRRRFK